MAPTIRWAKAMRLTKVGLLDGSYNKETDRSMNKLKYTLLGDPALPLMAPRQEILLDSINGVPINSSSKIQLKAGEKVRFSGHVIKDNAVDTGFSGVITGSLHDRKETINVQKQWWQLLQPQWYIWIGQTAYTRVAIP